MSGMNMLMKSMGINPDEIITAAKEFGVIISRIEARQKRIETMQETILLHFSLEIPPTVVQVDVANNQQRN